MPWYLGTLIGAVALALLNSMCRVFAITWINYLIILPPMIICQWGFWYGFSKAPSFINCWFLGTGLTALIAVPVGIIFFDKGISIGTIAGMTLILSGAYLLVR